MEDIVERLLNTRAPGSEALCVEAAHTISRLREEKEADKAAYEVVLAENRRLKAERGPVKAKETDYHVHSWKQSLDGVTMICDCGAWK